MLFEPYTRTGMLKPLDAGIGGACGLSTNGFSMQLRNHVGLGWILVLGGSMLLPVPMAAAQSPAAAPAAGTTQTSKPNPEKPPAHHTVRHHHHAKSESTSVAAAPATPPAPLPPAEQPANPATIDFKNGLLSVHAQNSSLISILNQIEHQTGLTVDGLNHDQRIYGQYGPGNLSTTLSALLDGSGYDFVIVGAGSAHASPRLILSTPGASGTTAPAPAPSPAPAVVNNEPQPNPDATEVGPPETSEGDAPQSEDDQGNSPDQGNASDQGNSSDQAGPADPTAPPQAKSPQEIFDELRKMHPQ